MIVTFFEKSTKISENVTMACQCKLECNTFTGFCKFQIYFIFSENHFQEKIESTIEIFRVD